jgi:phage RecT family recombinase
MANTQVATIPSMDQLAKMPIEQAVDVYLPNFIAALPADLPIEHFRSVVMTAINLTPSLARADRRTFLNECVKCASDGLLPDGREAVLNVYRTKIKINGQDQWIDACVYLPMVYGIRKRLRNSGEVLSAEAHAVYRGDHFKYALGDQAFIDHQPAALDADPGDVIGAYSIIKLANGETIRDVLRKSDIERARKSSKVPDGPMWKDHYGEAARKTALKRCAKSAPQSAAMQRLQTMLDRGEEIEMPDGSNVSAPPPRPTRDQFQVVEGGAGETVVEPSYSLTDCDGEIVEIEGLEAIAEKMTEILSESRRRSVKVLLGIAETNGALLPFLREHHRADLADALDTHFVELRDKKDTPPVAAGRPQTSESDKPVTDTPAGRQATQRPPDAPVADNKQPELPVADGEPGARSAWFIEREGKSLEIEPRQKGGKPDWQTYIYAQLIPRIRQATTNADLGTLLGHNEDYIATATQTLGSKMTGELDAVIAEQWAKIPPDA